MAIIVRALLHLIVKHFSAIEKGAVTNSWMDGAQFSRVVRMQGGCVGNDAGKMSVLADKRAAKYVVFVCEFVWPLFDTQLRQLL